MKNTYKFFLIGAVAFFIALFALIPVTRTKATYREICNEDYTSEQGDCIEPTITPEITPEPTVEPTATPSAQTNPGGPGDGRSDGRSDGKSSCPSCTQPPKDNFPKSNFDNSQVIWK